MDDLAIKYFSSGIERRICRLKGSENFYFILALDHGLTNGSLEGLENIDDHIKSLLKQQIPCLVINKGIVPLVPIDNNLSIILQCFGLPDISPHDDAKVAIATIDDAIKIGADAISVQLNLNAAGLSTCLHNIATYISKAHNYSFPVLLMVNSLPNYMNNIESLLYSIRMGIELGANLIKVPLPSNLEGLEESEVLKKNISIGPPIILAGGEKDEFFFERAKVAYRLGFKGICVGRNFFQTRNKCQLTDSIRKIFNGFA